MTGAERALPVSPEALADLLAVARSAALSAGRALRERAEGWTAIDSEVGHDIKLAADREAEAIVLRGLAGTPYRVLSEETGWTGGADDRLVWVVDPLDGTANYLAGIPLCAVSIGLMAGRRPVAGVVYAFATDELFEGAWGMGARLNGAPIAVSTETDPARAILATGFPASADTSDGALAAFAARVRAWRKVRMIGSAALAIAWVANARVHAYREENTNLWDVAGAAAIAAAAGARVDIEGAALDGRLTVTVRAPGLPPP
jgi:myo-inositol-1(or 4)-monophosphatase